MAEWRAHRHDARIAVLMETRRLEQGAVRMSDLKKYVAEGELLPPEDRGDQIDKILCVFCSAAQALPSFLKPWFLAGRSRTSKSAIRLHRKPLMATSRCARACAT